MGVENLRILEQCLNLLEGVDDLHQPRIVIQKGAVRDGAEALVKFLELSIGNGSATLIGSIQPAQRSDPVHSRGISERLEVGSLQIGLPQTLLSHPLGIVVSRDLILDYFALGATETQLAVVELEVSFGVDQSGIHARKRTEKLDLFLVFVERSFEKPDGSLGNFRGRLQFGKDAVASGNRKGAGHASGNNPRGMHALLREAFDDQQTKLAKLDAVARQFRMCGNHSQHVAGGGIGVHAQQKVRSGEIEKTEGMRLNDLRAVNKFPQFSGSVRNANGHDGIASLG